MQIQAGQLVQIDNLVVLLIGGERQHLSMSLHTAALPSKLGGEPRSQLAELCELFPYLSSFGGRRFGKVLRSLLAALSLHIEASNWLDTMSPDAISHAPVPMAITRARRVDPVLREQLAQEAGTGSIARTGGKAVTLLRMIRIWKVRRASNSVGHRAIEARAASYLRGCRNAFQPEHCNVVTVAMDASRMGGRDTMYLALYSPELKQACWLPPQVL